MASSALVFESYYLQCLAQASYIVGHKGWAFLIDPRRDTDMYLKELARHGLRLKGVLLTHMHADFVSGNEELRKKLGVTIFLGANAGAQYPHYPLTDGDTLALSDEYDIMAMETPGHTAGCVTYVLRHKTEGEKPIKAFTGDTLFIGSVGRPDLVGGLGYTEVEMATMMWDSLQNKILTLPDDVMVHPAHGAGSPCGKGLSTALHSTIGEQRLHNAALQIKTKEEFIAWDTADLPPAPGYFPEVVRLNKFGGDLVSDLASRAKSVSCAEAARLSQEPGTVVIDLRDADDFAAIHIKGSLNFPLGADDGAVLRPQDGNFGIWVGTLLSPKTPLLLVCSLGREIEAVQRLSRVGFENIVGVLTESGPVSALSPLWEAGCMPLESHTRHIWTDASYDTLRGDDNTVIVDVRTPGEYACVEKKHMPGAVNMPLGQLETLVKTADPSKRYVLYCVAGYRSAISVSIFRKAGLDAVDIRGGYVPVIMPWLKANGHF